MLANCLSNVSFIVNLRAHFKVLHGSLKLCVCLVLFDLWNLKISSFSCNTCRMPRKFRLSVHRKNEYRKKKRKNANFVTVMEPRDIEEQVSLQVSVPMLAYTNVSTLSQLQTRIQKLSVIPKGEPIHY